MIIPTVINIIITMVVATMTTIMATSNMRWRR